MPARLILHEGNALAFNRLQKNYGRFIFRRVESLKRFFQSVEVVPVDYNDIATECLEFFIKRRSIHNVFSRAVNLQTVHVDRDAEIIKFVMGGEHGCFPNLTFGEFAITKQGVNSEIFAEKFRAFSHTARRRNPLPQ